VWHDKRDVLLLSTNSDPRSDGTVENKIENGKQKTQILCPNAVMNYTRNMGGEDLNDQLRQYYGVGHSSKKWWKFVFHFIINVCIVNSFILYDMTSRPSRTSHGNRQLTYRKNLVQQLIRTYTSCKRTGRKRSLLIGTVSLRLLHCLEKITGREKVCGLCMQRKIQAPSGRGKQTSYKCKQCDFPQCHIECFLDYHKERGVEVQN
jgi:hypothetical protein